MKDNQQLLQAYQQLNRSFSKKCLFHVGASGGFFSEYNMMLLAMLYCLQHRIRFTLYSDDANFAVSKGWTDYFEPFCEEIHDPIQHKINQRPVGNWYTILKNAFQKRSIGPIAWKVKNQLLNGYAFFYKKYTHTTYYTQDIWNALLTFRTDDFFSIPELGIQGDLRQALHVLSQITWRMNQATQKEIQDIRSEISLPKEYIGCQIRGGDKFIEFNLVPVEAYIQMFQQHASCKHVFVLTDDYRIIQQLQTHHPDYQWSSLCQPNEQGYFHGSFVKNEKEALRQRMLRFFTSIDLLTRKEVSLFVGSRTTNPSVFVYIYSTSSCIDVEEDSNLLSHSTLGIQ